MKIERFALLDQLASTDQRCLGAAFTTFTFEPAFFENHVLAAILRVEADPDEAAAAYHEEALAILQETPIVCFVDGSMRVPGHQLPYDLREHRGRCFHPKVALLLFDSYARLAVGSANLTQQGYGRNAETVFVRDLRYADPADAAVLRDVAAFLDILDVLATPAGAQTQSVVATLRRRVAATPQPEGPPQLRFLHTEADTPLLPRVLALLPTGATITRLGILAPFFERDDTSADPADALSSVLLALASRAGKDAVLDLGVAWDDAPVAPSIGDSAAIADHLNTLWAYRYDERDDDDDSDDDDSDELDGATTVGFFVPTAVTPARYRITQNGRSRTYARERVDDLIAERAIWHVGTPRVFAPANLVERAREHVGTVRVWLHPGTQLQDGRPIERPLHAKLLVVTFRDGRKDRTLVVVGSANASRMALLTPPATGGNVEACVAFILDRELSLADLAPELAECDAPIDWQERTFPAPAPMPSVPLVESAVYSPRDQTLVVTWSAPAAGRTPAQWTLSYLDIPLARGDGQPSQPTRTTPFRLSPTSCELTVAAHDGQLTFPIVVDDLTALPLDGFHRALELRELLALVGRRITPARHKVIVQRHGRAMLDATLTSLLGENFAPTDVLRAWWNVAHDLATPGLTVAGFRLRLLGTLGAGAVWRRIHELAMTAGSGMRPEEAWFYGSELRRALGAVEIPQDPDQAAKRQVLDGFVQELVAHLTSLRPSSDGRSWVANIVNFYEEPRS